ncbi:MAG: 16S rRNA (adenine(1518)-N(6)/adenine(1519)-N(6))-dimethyltransferase RsmA [Holosporales bacterium]|jgi:16S rRNA (adenine1518-N6/adenine1519-N6)-dimethyltransferase|nr:16S rRNA (adenine(1518)-N(6)/adenine(1519)-N(6))-dimethyltransferase RsmA [Holosporales bacterium]
MRIGSLVKEHVKDQGRAKLPPLAEAIETLQTRKSLGQHFLVNEDICRRIAAYAGDICGKTVFEIGPGPGGLTRALLEQGAYVCAIEKDDRCALTLTPLQEVYGERFCLRFEDALRVDFSAFSSPIVVSNLPYNISTPLLFKWLPFLEQFCTLVLMFQKEVAERLYAQPRTKSYGRLSVLLQAKAHVTKLFHLPPGAFIPPPKVHSTVVLIEPKSVPRQRELHTSLDAITKCAFSTRRKMVKTTLSSLFSEQELLHLGISLQARAEELAVAQFLELAKYLAK